VRRPGFVLLLAAVLLLPSARAQTSPFLSDEVYRHLVNEVSGDIAYDHLRTLTQFHVPNGGARDFLAQARWIEARAREFGLSDVRIVDLPFRGTAWTPLAAELWLLEPASAGVVHERKLASFAEVAVSLADYSRNAGVEAELVDVGLGTAESDYVGRDVAGKVVLAGGPPADVEKLAVFQHGALGVVSYYTSRVDPAEFPDQIGWGRVNAKAEKDGPEPRWAFMLSYRTGMELRRRLAGDRAADPLSDRPEATRPQSLRVRATVQSEFHPEARQQLVEGWIRGRNRGPHVLLTSHVQEEKTSANDDRSGVANMLEIARALSRLLREGKLPQPERDIRFWWVNEFAAPYEYFAVHPEERAAVLVNINQDMVGAHLTAGPYSRVQHVTRTPWSRATFFNDVVESVVMALYHGNNAYLAARQTAEPPRGTLYTRPIFSRLGTRDRYALELVPYFGNTDHHVFNDAWIGAAHGGVTFTNWPDEYIHSSDDDLWQIDRTNLQRNAVAVAALALFMADAGPRQVPAVTAMLVPGALGRIQRDLRAATAARLQRRANAWDSENMLEQAVQREVAAVESLRTIAGHDAAALEHIAAARKSVEAARESARPSLAAAARVPSPPYPTPVAAGTAPQRIDSVDEYLTKRTALKAVPGLHNLMRFEAFNFADGKRSVWDIYSALRAQSLAAGEWYYGHVTPQMVEQLFQNAAQVGLVTLHPIERLRDVMVKPGRQPRK
jgi:hypothetical protein